jgi:transmembrane sensor
MTLSDPENNCEIATVEQIDAQAIEWVERADREDWNAESQDALDKWLALSVAHTIAFLRARDGWRRADRLAALRGTFETTRPSTNTNRWTSRVRTSAGALAIASIAALSFVWLGQSQRSEVYSTNVGGHRSLTLADGSQVELNTDTLIRTRLDAHRRTVWVDRGEVYFQIAHNAAKPFVVLASGHRITDLGTKFVVRQGAGEVQVTLIEGRAAFDTLDRPESRAILTPGEVAIATNSAMSVLKRSQQAVDNDLSWRRGILVFDRTPLSDAAAELNRYNTQKVIVADADAAQERIEGTFPANNVELFGRVAKSVLGLQVRKQGNDIVISR